MKKALQWLLGFVLLAWMLLGFFIVLFAPLEMYWKKQAESWPSRKMTIALSSPTYHSGRAGRHGYGPYYSVDICGNYVDTGERVCIDRIRYGGFRWGEGKSDAEAAAKRYPIGATVDVYYDPDDPRDTLLEAVSPWTEMAWLFGIGVGGLLLPVLLCLFRKQIEPERHGD